MPNLATCSASSGSGWRHAPRPTTRAIAWRCTWAHAGGGVLLNQASHDIDLLCWLFGAPAEVSAVVGNRGHAHEVEDTAIATVRFASGAVASLQFSTWARRLSYRQIDGDAGAVVWQDERERQRSRRP
jgi:predicted dehydrogenase